MLRAPFWTIDFGCWSSGNITDEMINAYPEDHRKNGDQDNSSFILELCKGMTFNHSFFQTYRLSVYSGLVFHKT